jgi:hypothetical protein
VASFIGVKPIKMITMFYAILGKLLKELLNANKTGHHVIPGYHFYWFLTTFSTMSQV